MKQILLNLLSNSIKYNQPGGTVVVGCTAQTPERVRVSVKDAGAGLPPEKAAQLFEPFNRLGQESGGEKGTGIGLVVTKRLIELMGGAIGVESTVGVGSVFWVELISDVEPQLPVAGDEITTPAQPQVRSGAQSHLVLYVEDNPANLKLVEHLLARRPEIRLLTAVDGEHGIELARTAQPDVILMDINLPGISGLEAIKILRAAPDTAHIPVVAISANALSLDVGKGLDAGFFRYLTKPIKVDEFATTLNMALECAASGGSSE